MSVRVMEWTDEHDVLFLREMIASDLFTHKKGSPDRGKVWEGIVDRLNSVQYPNFSLKDKRGVRDRWSLLQTKFKRRIREEEKASGIIPDELTEKDLLIEELCEKEESSISNSRKQSSDKEAAEDVRKKAMERMGETTKRKSEKEEGRKEKKSRRSGADVVEYLKEKAKGDQALRQEEMEARRKDQENLARQQEGMVDVMKQQAEQMQATQMHMLQQQQMMTQALMAVLQRVLEK